MSTLHPLAGMSQALERARTRPLQQLRNMNRSFYEALKVSALTFEQRSVFAQCLAGIPFPSKIEDEDVIAALADPDRDLLTDYAETDFRYRRRWHACLAKLGLHTEKHEEELEVKRRLGLVRRVLRLP
jgi:hypothetical protein